MEIKTKFNVGDIVYTIACRYEKQPCYICEGKKTIRIKNMQFGCPHCNCLGETTDKEVWYVDDEFMIGELKVWAIERPLEIRYFDNTRNKTAYEETCFASREEAQAECDKLNKGE